MAAKVVKRVTTAILLTLSLMAGVDAWAGQINDAVALQGVKQGKGIFLVDVDNPQKAALYLDIIRGTHESMVEQKVTPDFIVLFIGPTVRFLTTEPDRDLSAKQQEPLRSIAASVKVLKEKGVRLEICAIATNFFKVSNEKLLPELQLVGNGFISLIGYQSKGYGLVPIF